MDLTALRREYARAGIDEAALADAPHEEFERWFRQAQEADLLEPNACILGTVDAENSPSQRIVLLKQFDARGYVFYTNYESRKAEHIAANPRASLLFPWLPLERQVVIEGTASRISQSESLRYFMTRPLGNRLGAWASPQSRIIRSRAVLEMKLEEMKRKFHDGKVPLPSFWGGYRVHPTRYEFWQGRENRLHDRFEYRLDDNEQWIHNRLAP